MEDIQQSYSQDNERICLTADCPKRNKKIRMEDLNQHQNHYVICKKQILDRIKVLKCNKQNPHRKNIEQKLDQMLEQFTSIQRQFNTIYLSMMTNFYQYVKLVKNSFQQKEYQELFSQISRNFYAPKVVSAFNKASKYERIAFPYAQYPTQIIQKIKTNFDNICNQLKMNIQNCLSGFKQQMNELNIFSFIDVRPSQQVKFSRYLKNDVYETKEGQLQIQRIKENTANLMNMVVGAVALLQKQMKVDTQISFKIQCLPKTHACAIGLCSLQKAKEMNFKNCFTVGYFMTSSNGLLKKSLPLNNKNSAGWTFEEGDIITMKLSKTYLSWQKKGFITPYFASMIINTSQTKLYPACQIWGSGGKISIVK